MDSEVGRESRKHQLWRRWHLVVAAVGLLLLAIGFGLAEAQQNNRAGLIIQYGDGSVTTYCVDLAQADANGDGVTMGDEVLRAAQPPVAVEVSALGPAVCKVGNEGCDYPANDCFCECTLAPGSNCRYWSYNRLQGNQWVFSGRGAGSTVVRPGDVEGWVWGFGTINAGAQPAARSFNDICAQQAQAATATPSRTITSSPTTGTPSATPGTLFMPQLMHDLLTLTPGPSPSATTTRSATRTVAPTAEGASAPAAATDTAVAPTNNPPVQPSDAPQIDPTSADSSQQETPSIPASVEEVVPTATLAFTPSPPVEEVTQPPVGAPTVEGISADVSPSTPSSAAIPYPPAEAIPPPETTLPTAIAGGVQQPVSSQVVLAPVQPAGNVPPTATVADSSPQSNSSYGQYVAFVALLGLLAAGWFVLQRQRGNA